MHTKWCQFLGHPVCSVMQLNVIAQGLLVIQVFSAADKR